MIATYCALVFQIINNWDGDIQTLAFKDQDCKHAQHIVQYLNYTDVKFGIEVITWGATLSRPEVVDPSDLLKELSYFVDFDGDGRACWSRQ